MSFDPTPRLDGKVAVIAGGLGAIGYATAQRLAALGATCVLLHRGADDAAQRAAALPAAAGQRHAALRADIIDTPSLQ
jgi:NAD(P)-dependent dehydrogenase (short-subunit alcohol dehydrogenase family)